LLCGMFAGLMEGVEGLSASLRDGVKAQPEFAAAPASWYFLATVKELARKPVRMTFPDGQVYVGFRTESGRLAVISGRCSHMGIDLSLGRVTGERLACPLHGWEYGTHGVCEHIPAGGEIPDFARQVSFPVEECGGQVFFFNRVEARFPLPFFDGTAPEQLLAARRFEFSVEVPWYLASANGFDVQHFRNAHDRVLEGEPVVDSPHPFAWRLTANFRVSGSSFLDRLTKYVSGPRVKLTVTIWCGNLVLVSAQFRRTTSYGMVSFVPQKEGRTWVRDIVWVPRSRTLAGRLLLDPLAAEIRRVFIREFVRADAMVLDGFRFNAYRTIAADNVLVNYLDWLHKLQP